MFLMYTFNIYFFKAKLSPGNDVPEMYRQLLLECLQEIIYPQIYDKLFPIYKQHVSNICEYNNLCISNKKISLRKKILRLWKL